ncbi:hypothetical protein TPHA_0O00350 [Tetrapisispora phaffii CBS 4417]|uniref:Nucleolar 27S pre-rRNA processing Urb2/Npa2 C-terminal domain-containing protein n=1 Tax=Tetrapisispora phaffii (strain ATCC 24235 / CBS 4417 / NBRC 1672 / NRRL Y-8282 / UCD 70-5) TaxID=1071381 RepID=G8C1H8_TETPH|nr:hypothetical protein TPHA_0O00350 [Tetrapisispora phaffii CBS 4417]CCE66006.1 hypothetical protein TPHA_0O00350 [Tetrapisispora phaffii CBS 4417]
MLSQIPDTAEGITKLLRSKNTTASDVVEVVFKFSELKTNFPNKEVFVLELIQDRWNDQRVLDYKNNYQIWRLYNDMWSTINNSITVKKLFKNLKFPQLVLQSTQIIEQNKWEFLNEFYRTCTLINSEVTVAFTFEIALKCLASILGMLCDVRDEVTLTHEFRANIIDAVIKLTDLNNIKPEVSIKYSNTYCETLLLPTLKYMVRFNDTDFNSTLNDKEHPPNDNTIEKLLEYSGYYLYDSSLHTPQQLEKLIKKSGASISFADSKLLFNLSINFLSKQNFKDLEKILILLTNLHQDILPDLLIKLALKRKTLSHEFLETLFKTTVENAQKNMLYDETFWSLITHILELDIEIGIKNTNQILVLIENQYSNNHNSTFLVFEKLITCYVNAREYPNFISIWAKYVLAKDPEQNNLFFSENLFTNALSRNITALSISQLSSVLASYIHDIQVEKKNARVKGLLEILLHGLKYVSPTILPELKIVLIKVFDDNLKSNKTLWRIRFLIMEAFDDIVTEESIEEICSKDFKSLLKSADDPKYLFFNYFKIREYKEFKLTDIIEEFIKYLKKTEKNEMRDISGYIFLHWPTLISNEFSKSQVDYIIDLLINGDMEEVMSKLFEDDDFFEEPRLVSTLVAKLASEYKNDIAIRYLREIPIQCIQKNVRIQLIDSIGSKAKISQGDLELVNHLLQYPTFKTKIETDIEKLYVFTKSQSKKYDLINPIFERVWSNYLSQMKERSQKEFIDNMINMLLSNISKGHKFFEISFLICKISPTVLVDQLQSKLIEISLTQMKKSKDDELIWNLNCLFTIFKKSDYSISAALNKSVKDEIANILKTGFNKLNKELMSITFLIYSSVYDNDLQYLFAHYLKLRNLGIPTLKIIEGVNFAIKQDQTKNFNGFNLVFSDIINEFSNVPSDMSGFLLELFISLLDNIEKENVVAVNLFQKSLSDFFTSSGRFINNKEDFILVLKTFEQLLLSKPWLFSQYSIELLFPICYNAAVLFNDGYHSNDDIFIITTKVISKILLVHRVKLSNRNHLLNSFFCSYLELLSLNETFGLTEASAGPLARLISNFCEPSNISSSRSQSNKEIIDSKISMIRHSLRKDVPVLLINYIHLSINNKFKAEIRHELIPCIYSVLNLLSRQELNIVNAALDNAGKQYFRTIYQDYTKKGKWSED